MQTQLVVLIGLPEVLVVVAPVVLVLGLGRGCGLSMIGIG